MLDLRHSVVVSIGMFGHRVWVKRDASTATFCRSFIDTLRLTPGLAAHVPIRRETPTCGGDFQPRASQFERWYSRSADFKMVRILGGVPSVLLARSIARSCA